MSKLKEPQAESAGELPAEPAADEALAVDEIPGMDPDPDPAAPPGPAPVRASWAWLVALAVTALCAGAVALAFQPERAGTRTLLGILGCNYFGLAVVTLIWLRSRGVLADRLRPAAGDISKGFALAALLYGAALLGHRLLTPTGSLREGWIIRFYLQIGEPAVTTAYPVALAVLLIGACSEIVWRGLVAELLVGAHGQTRGWLLSSALGALSWAPSMILLGDLAAGPNPAVVAAALASGLAWGLIAVRTRRLVPMVFSHALALWAVVQYPVWRIGLH